MYPTLFVIVLLIASTLLASNIEVHAPRCHITPPNIIISGTSIPLADHILELITAYGKHTASTTAALDSLRYAGLDKYTDDSSQIPIRRGKHSFSTIGILLDSAMARASRLEEQLVCIQEALDKRAKGDLGVTWMWMKKVVDVLVEELEGQRGRLDERKRVWVWVVGGGKSDVT